MSVGFVGSSYQSVADINGSGARLDVSLQSVLNKYDSIATDLDRLANSATFNVYDLTSRQKYGDYNKDAQSGWSESWYAEYRAVLQMRADALKKRLGTSYNRVLERSVYTEIAPDNESVFAPYANRTAALTQVNFQTPVSEVFVKDVKVGDPLTAVTPPTLPSIVTFDSIDTYLANPSADLGTPASNTVPTASSPSVTLTAPITSGDATYDPATGGPGATRIFSSIPTLAAAQYQAFRSAIYDSFRDSVPPINDPPVGNLEKMKAKDLTDSIIAALISISSGTVSNPGGTATGGAVTTPIDAILAYASASMVKPLLGTSPTTASTSALFSAKPIALPPDGVTRSGYQPDAYYSMSGPTYLTNAGTYVALPVAPGPVGAAPDTWPPQATTDTYYGAWTATMAFRGVYPNANTTGTAINTPNQPQNQNATLTGDGYLFDVNFAGPPAGSMTIVGTNSTGGAATIGSASVFSLNVAGSDPTSGMIYTNPATIIPITIPVTTGNTTSADFITYGTTPIPVDVHYIDDLQPSNSSIAAQICANWQPLPPVGRAVAFKTRFPLDWYINSDPRLGVKGGNSTGSVAGTDFVTYTGGAVLSNSDFVDRSANPIQNTGGLYYTLRQTASPTPPAGYVDPNTIVNPTPAVGPINTFTPAIPTLGPTVTYANSYEKAIGNADLFDQKNYSNAKVIVPQYGAGVIDINELFKGLPQNVRDTMINDPEVMATFNTSLNEIVNSFVGRQYDDIVQGNYYAGKYDCSDSSFIGSIDTIAAQYSALTISATLEAYIPSTSLLYAGAGSTIGLIPTPTLGSIYTGGIGPDLNYGHWSAINQAGSFATPIPTVGLYSVGANVPIPIVIPPAISFTLWIGGRTQKTRDIATEFIEKFLSAVKPLVVEAIQTQSYSASGGTAFDTYASRGEYHFSTPGYIEAMRKLKFSLFGIDIPLGEMVESFVKGGGLANLVSLGNAGWGEEAYKENINGVSAGDRLFEIQHSNQGAENKETDAGAFFATQSFLSQFQMKNMESEYWIGTQQNEEIVNTDMLRALQTSGGQLMNMMTDIVAAGASIGSTNVIAAGVLKLLVAAINGMNDKAKEEMWYNLLFTDVNYKGFGFGQNGWMKGEGYDYLEPDHKPFQGDSDFNYPEAVPFSITGAVLDVLTGGGDVFTAKKPDFVMDGYSSTMRFRKASATTNAIEAISASALSSSDSTAENGYGARGQAGRSAGGAGIWDDTALGDINEVYVGKRKVVFNDLENGFGAFESTTINGAGSSLTNTNTALTVNDMGGASGASRTTYAYADRYTGADTRAYGKRYDGATPINFESFNTGLYTEMTDSSGNKLLVDSGSKYHYDRRNEYSLSFQTAASNNVINLQGSQALNPSIGGFIKLAEIDKNKTDDALLQYESIDQSTLMKTGSVTDNVLNLKGKARGTNEQKFGGSADGKLNEFNKILYESMHLRADGRNLSEFNEYRDVFNMGFMKNFFVSGQSYHPSGGGISSSLEIRFDTTSGTGDVQRGSAILGVTGTREDYNHDKDGNLINFDPYNTLTLNKSRGKASVYLNNYFAYKKRANKK